MKKFAAMACIGISALLVGCDNSAPKCADQDTQDLVLEIARDELVKMYGNSAASTITMELDMIRTTDTNEKTGTHTCAAELVFKGPGGTEKGDITYTSENTDESDEFYVTVYGL
ncbi:hypothetical protein VST7929_00213 [Vibrio stylophorae]|uniref:Lipoprotein n=1 Tax=Vibrio stylophorae TaxID=659351 RepID=A0ABM8ZQ04_9VIBR|nr:hypothetical protein [Vibrio stylophorae]CAH0532384.1 hypothetical protein VST7929_00213 [Vibrio stylophorae]